MRSLNTTRCSSSRRWKVRVLRPKRRAMVPIFDLDHWDSFLRRERHALVDDEENPASITAHLEADVLRPVDPLAGVPLEALPLLVQVESLLAAVVVLHAAATKSSASAVRPLDPRATRSGVRLTLASSAC